MFEVKETDWKLFRKLLPKWQEDYMKKLNKEYVALLTSDEPAYKRFWELDKRINKDKKCGGVILYDIRRKNMSIHIASLLADEVITMDDLDGFSEELCQEVKVLARMY